MIHLITGVPGSGKTLYALNYVQTLTEGGKRPVYYDGIAELTLPWEVMADAQDWHKLPTGAIVVIDEAQRIFRPRGNGAVVPAHVAALETHRHQGIDLVIITQHPMLVDTNLRRLVGRHFHVVRSFGMQRATVHEWGEVKVQCDVSRSDSIKHQFAYPKDSFQWYKSAEVHTHKRRIPARMFFLLLLPLLLGAIVYGFASWTKKKIEAPVSSVPVPGSLPLAAPGGSKISRAAAEVTIKSPLERTAAYASARQPAVPGLAFTADRYESVTQAKVAPAPVACASSASRGCRCYSQQGTVLQVGAELCAQIVAEGFFMDWAEPVSVAAAAAPGAPGRAPGPGLPPASPLALVPPQAVPEGAAAARPQAAPVVPAHGSTRTAISPPSAVKK